MAKRSKSARAERRAHDRGSAKLTQNLEKLAALEPGASVSRAIVIAAPSEVEVHARSSRCVICRGDVSLEEHRAELIEGRRLRVASVVCRDCGRRRDIFFELAANRLN